MNARDLRPAWYFAGALGWTWAWLGLALASGASATEPPTSWLRLVAGVGPVVTSAVLVRRHRGEDERRRFWRRVVDLRAIAATWWVVIALASAGPGVLVWLGGERHLDVASAAALAGIVGFAVAASFAEEPGWRGYALDALGESPLRAAALISVAWAAWHLPLYAIDGTFQHDDVGLATPFFWILQCGLIPQTVLMIWILEHTRPSILPAVVFHALVNVSGEVFEYTSTQQAVRLTIWLVAAAACAPSLARAGRRERRTEVTRRTATVGR